MQGRQRRKQRCGVVQGGVHQCQLDGRLSGLRWGDELQIWTPPNAISAVCLGHSSKLATPWVRTEQGMLPQHLVCGWVGGWVEGA